MILKFTHNTHFDMKLKDPRIKLLEIRDGVEIYLIDSVRASVHDARWTLESDSHLHVIGNHHWGEIGSYIPHNEVWISDKVTENERSEVIFHELYERKLCIKGIPVKKAHIMTVEKERELGIIKKVQGMRKSMQSMLLGEVLRIRAKTKQDNYLLVNDPKTGWSHAIEISVKNLDDATRRAAEYKAKNKKYGFSARIDGKPYWYKNGKFIPGP